MKNSLALTGFFLAGGLVGRFAFGDGDLPVQNLDLIALFLLLFFVGLATGGDSRAWRLVRRVHWRLVIVPVGVVVGTFTGAGLLALIWPGLSLGESLSVGAGFGYYSLSSVLLTRLGESEELGLTALLANIMRELMTLLLAPLMVHWFGRLGPVCAGGATAMDTTLPVITRCSGKDYAVVAVFSGFTLTMLVPLLLPLLVEWFL